MLAMMMEAYIRSFVKQCGKFPFSLARVNKPDACKYINRRNSAPPRQSHIEHKFNQTDCTYLISIHREWEWQRLDTVTS